MTQDHAFEEKLSAALRSDEMPSADFTARVMAQVAKTPQVKAAPSRKAWKIAASLAACFAAAAIAVPLFFGTMRAGSAAPAAASDCAAPAEEESAAVEEAAEYETAGSFALPAETESEAPAAAENGVKQHAADADSGNGFETVTLSDTALCQQAREILDEMGSEDDGGRYTLTAEQGAALHEAMPELKLPAGAFVLILEG